MMTVEMIKNQMEVVGVNANQLSKITRMGYATVSDLVNGKAELKNTRLNNYERLVGTLFTNYEQYIYIQAVSKSTGNPSGYWDWYNELINRKLKLYIEEFPDKIIIDRSGAATGDENGPTSVPAYVGITLKDADGNHSIRIFNDELYNAMNNAGKKGKFELLKSYVM